MKTVAAAALLSILSFTSASPIDYPSGNNWIDAENVSLYVVNTNAVVPTQGGKIFKDGRSSDITTLATFDIPSSAAGRTCSWHFNLSKYTTLEGSGKFDLFATTKTATGSATRPPRGNQVGRFTANQRGAEATPGADGIPTHMYFPCPAGQKLSAEMVGVGDNDWIEWNNGQGYLQISY